MSTISHREVDHENNGFIILADEVTQNHKAILLAHRLRINLRM